MAGDLPDANTAWAKDTWHFGWHRQTLPDGAPDWFVNPFSESPQPQATQDWWQVPDFGGGDIKGLWELSRFNWAVAWSTEAAQGDGAALKRLNAWTTDWAASNPPYKGPNWKCGQEASIRVMHLCLAAWLLGQDDRPEPGLAQLLVCHLQRIAPTLSYAIGQANNHGTSEAAALFIGGTLLEGQCSRAAAWACKGRRWLEERAQSLIEPDGSFSQYSVNYHRVMLDSFALAEAWRRHRALPQFSQELRRRLAVGATWLHAMTDAQTGDAPNIGANDGARLIPLTDTVYRDFRPSVQLATALFHGRRAYGAGPWDATLEWLEIALPEGKIAPPCQSFDDGGYHVLRQGQSLVALHYPRFRFRPSQADALHLDLWCEGINLLRDAGTYSYNAEGGDWFAGTSAHNTVEFDGRDQMPRLGRFLFGKWLKARGVERVVERGGTVSAAAGYRDYKGAKHYRRVELSSDRLVCNDRIAGNAQVAVLRWRLAPGDWLVHDSGVSSEGFGVTLRVASDQPLKGLRLVESWESRYYLRKTRVPVLEVELPIPAEITTEIRF